LWLLYATTIAFALGYAAALLERALRWSAKPARFVWAAALLTSCALPLWSALRPRAETAANGMIENKAASWILDFSNFGSLLDRPLLLASIALSLAVVGALALAQRAVLRDRASWREHQVDGTPVLVSPQLGPGVWVLGRARIVVPAWCLGLDERVRSLLVAHEREHVRARDHWLLLLGLFALILFPLNAGLWWQFRRLKLAIEMDCDARVLSGRQDVRGYATLLLDVGQRCRTGHLAFAAFAAPRHAIERRIRMMLDPKPRSHRLLAGACAASAVVIGVLACNAPEPAAPPTAVRSALGLTAPPEPPPAPAKNETHSVEEEKAEAYKVLYDPAELPPPPPPPPKPEFLDKVVRVQGAMVAEKHSGRATYFKSVEKPPEIVETKGSPLKRQK
jgi:beta-lactamase regulating signal transducer with metallopeptidase domain